MIRPNQPAVDASGSSHRILISPSLSRSIVAVPRLLSALRTTVVPFPAELACSHGSCSSSSEIAQTLSVLT